MEVFGEKEQLVISLTIPGKRESLSMGINSVSKFPASPRPALFKIFIPQLLNPQNQFSIRKGEKRAKRQGIIGFSR